MSALAHTMSDSARPPWAATCVPFADAASMIWSHVTGFERSRPMSATSDLRYQSSWVLAQNGTVTRLPCHDAPSTADGTTPSVTRAATPGGTGARKPASANSGM